MLKIGLTGSIGVGKTVVANFLREQGCIVFDADKIAQKVMEPQMIAYNEVVKEFGSSILLTNKSIDRAKLGAIVFSDQNKRKCLNAIVHPRVLEEQDKLFSALPSDAIVIIEAALMIEAGSQKRFDKLVVVHCNHEMQIKRIIERNKLTREEAERRIAAQLSSKEKCHYADYIIDTSGTLDETRQRVLEVYVSLKG